MLVKKTVKDENGIDVYLEGTAEEIEEFEKKIKRKSEKNESSKKKKEILKDQVRKLVQEELAQRPAPIEHHHHHWNVPIAPAPMFVPSPMWIEPINPYPQSPWYTQPQITWTVQSGNDLDIPTQSNMGLITNTTAQQTYKV